MYKQIIIVRKDLNMSHGKMAGQVAHASAAFFTNLLKEHVAGEVYSGAGMGSLMMKPLNKYRIDSFDIEKGIYEEWIDGIFTKVVLQAKNKNQLLKAKTMAEEMGLIEGKDFFLIKDNCNTELEPEEIDEKGHGRCLTCIGFKPMDSEVIDKISKKYHLYMD